MLNGNVVKLSRKLLLYLFRFFVIVCRLAEIFEEETEQYMQKGNFS